MNKIELIGRLTRDPEVRTNAGENGGTSIARYTLAVERRYHREGDATADFINCVAFGKSAEFVEKYLRKGIKIAVVGRLQTGSYTNKDGVKVYTTDVVVEEHEFVESRANNEASAPVATGAPVPSYAAPNGFMNVPDGIDDDDIPFN